MAQFLGTVQLGGFYNNGTILKRPTKPWRPDSTVYSGCEAGDIPQMSGSMANYTIGDTPTAIANRLQWHKIKDGDKTLLVCDRVILVSVSWNDLNEQGYITGKTITIDGVTYKCRVLTGGSTSRGNDTYAGGSPANNEWDRFITREDTIAGLPAPLSSDLDTVLNATDKDSTHNQFWNWFGIYSLCQETYGPAGESAGAVRRGYKMSRHWDTIIASGRYNYIGFRPVLEVLNTAPTTPGSSTRVTLGSKAVGSIVKLNVGGVAKEFLVVHQGLPGTMYDASCNGTWLLMEDCYETRQWNNTNVNEFESCTLDAYLNSTFLGLFDANIQAAIKQVKIPYRKNGGSGGTTQTGANGLPRKIFPLSATEVNLASGEGAVLSYFASCATNKADIKRVAKYNGSIVYWYLRTPSGNTQAIIIIGDGYYTVCETYNSYGIRPAMIMPTDLMVDDDGFVIANTSPETASAITIPSQINGGSTITIEWGASSDAEGNLEGYKVERSLDGGSTWTQVYQGGSLSTTNTVPFGAESVMYRVKAYDSEGLESGWKTSGQVTVINNTAPTVPGYITVPEQVQGGQPLAIAWGTSTDGENNLAGYSLERQVDGEGWAVVYSGNGLSFTDTITKGWETVAYRVRAYDIHNAYSGFAVSETREVNNNTPPAITCEQPYGTNLGAKDAGFEIPYSVSDEEGDDVTVTEAVDGAAWHTFAVELGEENSFTLGGVDFMKLLNGMHTLTITAADDKSSAVHSLSFEKLVTSASVTLAQPMPADGLISVCVLSVSGSIPMDAAYTVEVTNNGLDDEPVWEDCTAAVKAGANHVFENETAENGFAFNFRLNVERGESGLGGYITSVQGGFQ